MIYIITAMYAEAHPFITRFRLKKDISHTRFQVFLNKEEERCLAISGTGPVPAASAVSSICTKYGAGQGDFLLNVGVCAQIWPEKMRKAENTFRAGEIFLCSKLREQATGRTFYPDILYRHRFAEAQIVTGARPYERPAPVTRPTDDRAGHPRSPYEKPAPGEIRETDFCLYDMEAAAIYQAGAYYLGPHQMSFIKIISDDGDTKKVSPGQIEQLINRNMETITAYITNLQAISREGRQDGILPAECQTIAVPKDTQAALGQLCLDLHCSRTMSDMVRQYIRYCILSGTDYASVLEEMYREGMLPCKDKREGKQRFEELKERLL